MRLHRCKLGELQGLLLEDFARLDGHIKGALVAGGIDGAHAIEGHLPIAFGMLRGSLHVDATVAARGKVRVVLDAPHAAGDRAREPSAYATARAALSETNICEDFAVGHQIEGIDRIVVAMEERRGKLPVDLLLSMKNRGVQVQDGNDVYESITGKVPIESMRLSWLLFSPGYYASRLSLIYKRFASVVISIVGLMLSLPLLPFIVLAIKAELAGASFVLAEPRGTRWCGFSLLQIPHDAIGRRGGYRANLGRGRRSANHAGRQISSHDAHG